MLLPGGVRLDLAGVFQHRIQRRGTQRMHTPAIFVRFGHRGQALQLRLQLPGQRDEAPIAQRHEPPLDAIEAFEQEAHLQHLLLIQRHRTIDAEPVAVLGDPQLQLAGLHRTDPHRAAFRPFDRNGSGVGPQFQQKFQATLKVLDHQFVQVRTAAVAQCRTGLSQSGSFHQFAGQIAVGA